MKYSIVHSLSVIAVAFALAACVGVATVEPAPAPLASNEAFVRTIEDGGSGPFKAVLAQDVTLATHTIFRPADLSAFGKDRKLPILAWGNGGCANSPQPVVNFLSEIASHGFLVIAIGPTQPGGATGANPPGGSSRSSQLLDAIDWATAQNAARSSRYFGKIDTSKIAVMGTSCGGLQALEVSPDPRITTTIVANSGILNGGPSPATTTTTRGNSLPGMPPLAKDYLTKLHAPVLYILGGTSDMATPNGSDDFRRIEKLPAYFASINVGHGGTFSRPHGGEFAPVTVAWLQWQLKGDVAAAGMFTGSPSGLSQRAGWTVEKKNIR